MCTNVNQARWVRKCSWYACAETAESSVEELLEGGVRVAPSAVSGMGEDVLKP
jgi:hypothetical protein